MGRKKYEFRIKSTRDPYVTFEITAKDLASAEALFMKHCVVIKEVE